MKDIKLDKVEKEIESDAEQYREATTKNRQRVKKVILKTNEKNRVTLRLSNQTLERIKQKAQEEGLPYQTLISSILHKYANDKLIDEKHIRKSIQLLKYE
jgi:predicted DNA binding CopG/RHH family protein